MLSIQCIEHRGPLQPKPFWPIWLGTDCGVLFVLFFFWCSLGSLTWIWLSLLAQGTPPVAACWRAMTPRTLGRTTPSSRYRSRASLRCVHCAVCSGPFYTLPGIWWESVFQHDLPSLSKYIVRPNLSVCVKCSTRVQEIFKGELSLQTETDSETRSEPGPCLLQSEPITFYSTDRHQLCVVCWPVLGCSWIVFFDKEGS